MKIIFGIIIKLKEFYFNWSYRLRFLYLMGVFCLIFAVFFLVYFFTTDFIFSLTYYLSNFNKLDHTPLSIALGLAIYLVTLLLITNNLNKKNSIIEAERDELKLLNLQYIQEIKKRKKTEKSLKIATQSLEQSSKLAEIGQMSAAINHEISQPLSALKTYLSSMKILLDRNRVPEAKSNFNRINDLIIRMEKITTQLKLFSRKSENYTDRINLLDSVDASISILSPQFIDKRVKIKYKKPDKQVFIIGDELKIQQIIINLLNNSMDAVNDVEEPIISIKVETGESVSKIKIMDNGSGIDDLNEIFKPFYTTKSAGKGVGLGLSISSDLAIKLGGELSATNLIPFGSEFSLILRNG